MRLFGSIVVQYDTRIRYQSMNYAGVGIIYRHDSGIKVVLYDGLMFKGILDGCLMVKGILDGCLVFVLTFRIDIDCVSLWSFFQRSH